MLSLYGILIRCDGFTWVFDSEYDELETMADRICWQGIVSEVKNDSSERFSLAEFCCLLNQIWEFKLEAFVGLQ